MRGLRAVVCLSWLLLWAAAGRGASVADYGARGDDLLDDTVAIQRCLFLNTEVSFPAGIYHISSKVSVRAGRTVHGVDGSPESVVIRLTGTDQGFEPGGPSDGITIRDLTIERVAESLDNWEAVALSSGEGILLKRLRILNNRAIHSSLIVSHSREVRVEEVSVENYQIWNSDLSRTVHGIPEISGTGIRCDDCSGGVISACRIVESRDLRPGGTPPRPGLEYGFQGSGIEISGSTDFEVRLNLIRRAGQGIDAGQAVDCEIAQNRVDEIFGFGIKLVNGTRGVRVLDNLVERCGLTGVVLHAGSLNLPSTEALIDGNALVGMGQGIGGDGYWLTGFSAGNVPAGIYIGVTVGDAPPHADNVVSHNRFYRNESMVKATVVDRADPGQNPAVRTTFEDNLVLAGDPPELADCDGDEIPDAWEIAAGTAQDSNGNGTPDACEPSFRRGDSNADGAVDVSDAIAILEFLFLGSTTNDCEDAADVNDDGEVDISDPVRLLGFLFLGSEAPPEPFGTCGRDLSTDDLDCNVSGKCS